MKHLRKLLSPLSPLYGLVVWLRNKAYDTGLLASESFSTPLLCVGNLSVGGTGKTPMVEWLVRYFSPDLRVAVLSRGYGRKSKGFRWVTKDSAVSETGDEPLQMARRFQEVPFAVDADRRHGVQKVVSERNPELIILDDAFQHRRVRPQISILLTAWDALYSEQCYLPAGDLRDHKSQAARADLVVVTKCPAVPLQAQRSEIRSRLGLPAGQPLAFSTLRYDAVRDGKGNVIGEEELRQAPLTLVTGIAKPGPLLEHLDALDIPYTHLAFPDHHAFTEDEAARIKACKRVLTTAKDATRLSEFLTDFWVIGVAHHFSAADLGVVTEVLDRLD